MARRPKQHIRNVRTRYGRKPTVINKGIWYGAKYHRSESDTWRNRGTGEVVDAMGRLVNIEPTREHPYGYDKRKGYDVRPPTEKMKELWEKDVPKKHG